MKNFLLFIFIITSQFLFAHNGELISINNVNIDSHCEFVFFEFELENVNEILLNNVRIELQAKEQVIHSKEYASIPLKKYTDEVFAISVDKFKNIDPHDLQIVVTEIFDLEKDWGGWHGFDPSTANYNDIGDFEIYADAPWRMGIYDENNNKRPIPIHMLLHDGEQILLQEIKPNLEFIDIYIKKSTESEFRAINFDQLSSSQFDALITTKSPDADSIGIQSFLNSMAEKDANHTIAFKEKYNANKDFYYTHLNNTFWYFTLMLPPEELSDFTDDDYLDIRVEFTLRNISGQQNFRNSYLRVFRNKEDMPKLPGYYRGDTHVHTVYSLSIIEFGNPLEATKEAADAIGVDWIIITDHTASFDEWRGGDVAAAWNRLGEEVDALNVEDPSIVLIKGQEISLNSGQGELIHFLAYPGYETPTNLPYIGDGGGDIILTQVTARSAFRKLEEINGFAYAAHPFATEDEVPIIGGHWNIGDVDFPFDGQQFDVGGHVLCNKLGAPSDIFSSNNNELIVEGLKGAQIWGDRFSMVNETNAYDPYNIRDEAGAALFEATPIGDKHYLNRYRQGEQVVNFVNLKGLKEKNANPDLKNFKFYFSAGTDAHGSFNYSNTSGFGTVFDVEDVEVKNVAFGNIACIAYCPDGMGAQGENALKAMHDGSFSLTDGPIIVQGMSLDGANTENEVMMGMDTIIELEDVDDVFMNFQLASTEEFGAATYLKVFVGTEDGEQSFTITELADYEDAISMSLEEVLQEAELIIQPNKYIYVRAELQTLANYGANSPRILDEEYFHAFTNPTWVKVNDLETAIFDEQINAFSIYPNPVSENLFIKSDLKIKDVSVFNAEGKLVLQKKLRNNLVNVSSLPSGNYTLQAIFEGEVIVRKFVVQ